MNILFVTSESSPFVKVGGLGDVMYSLPKALRDSGHDARVMMPRYASIDHEKFPMQTLIDGLKVPRDTSGGIITCNVKSFENTFFLENLEFYEKRANVYGYDDDATRWALLSRGVLEFVKSYETWRPDVIVACDWQGGLIPNFARTVYGKDSIISKIPIVFSIHNLYYQGMFDHRFVSEMDYDDGQSDIPDLQDPRILKINFMRRGIRYADVINTVSSTYSQEITTPQYGELLDALLSERRSKLFGILNGIDYDVNDPQKDARIEYKFSPRRLKRRAKNKEVLRQKFNLPEPDADREDPPIIGMVTRLTDQKGLDLVMEIAEPLLSTTRAQFVLVGTGDTKYLSFFQELDKKYDNVATHLSYDDALPHMIYAGADMILVPSRYEPCGLTQMEAMRYGAVPIVRKTGGLADSVDDFHPATKKGTGFVFDQYNGYALYGAIIRAMEAYRYPAVWQGIQKRAMNANFSWDSSAKEYLKLFEKAIQFHELG